MEDIPKNSFNNTVHLSIDFEDFAYNLKRTLGLNQNNEIKKKALLESYKIINNYLITKLDGAKITFFCTGIVATEYPDLIKKISNDGHEIACHYYFHDSVRNEGLEEFEKNIVLALNALNKCSNNKVTGFRAPNFSINTSDVNHFKIISKYFEYDSSLNFFKESELARLKKIINSTKFKFILVAPQKPYPGFPYMKSGGSFLKLLHVNFILKIISKNLTNNHFSQIYLHPYEFVSNRSFYTSWIEMNGLAFHKKIYWLVRQAQWHIVGNNSVMGKLDKIFSIYAIGGKIQDL